MESRKNGTSEFIYKREITVIDVENQLRVTGMGRIN